MLRPSLAVAVAGLLLVGVVLIGREDADAHGTLDQAFTGNPDCNFDNFKGSLSTPQSIYQEFAQTPSTLLAVDVCSSVFEDGETVEVNIRTGTAAAPGPIVASASLIANQGSFQWIHLDLDQPVPVSLGDKLVIEMPQTEHHDWISTCGEVFGTCDHIDVDEYPAGDSSAGSPRDFVFRSYGTTDFPLPWADFDCSNDVQPADGLAALRTWSGVEFDLDCLTFGHEYPVDGITRIWGDINCDGAYNLRDILDVFAYKAGLTVQQAQGCPGLEDIVVIVGV